MEFGQRLRHGKRQKKAGRGEGKKTEKEIDHTATGILVVSHKSIEMGLKERVIRANLFVSDS